ncbi:hypothetical protein KC930_01520 [Candidatus Saccharibacteria bacterium]|nr:hypothetical protein [Candidatus Saccharibacteria bacterium]
MDSLKDLLLAKDLDQPSDMKAIQAFLEKNLDAKFSISDYPNHLTISVGNGKLAYHLRTMLPALVAYSAPTKDIRIRIDSNLD